MKKIILLAALYTLQLQLMSQSTFPTNGAPNTVNTIYAFINAVIHVNEEQTITNGTMLVKNERITEIGEKLTIPKHAVIIDLKGKHIYPSFIDLYTEYGMPENTKERRNGFGPQMESNVKGAYGWNQAIKSDAEAHKIFTHQKEQAEVFKKNGIGVVLTSKKDGIVRGSGALVMLNNSKENESFVSDKCAAFYSLNKGSSTQDYPSSLTGAIALLRQTYCDARWYKNNATKTEYNISLEAFNELQSLPSVFESNDKFNNLRAAEIGKEFNVKYLLKTGNNDYQRIEDLKVTGLNCIVPVNFPAAYDVEDPLETDYISVADLKHWELAPTNPAAFEKNNIAFCFTTADLKDKKQFLPNIRKAIKAGLSEKAALKALTVNPASFINAQGKTGSLKKGLLANFFISDKNIFEEDASVMEHWVNGERQIFSELNVTDVRGNYLLEAGKRTFTVFINGEAAKPKATVKVDTSKINAGFTMNQLICSLNFAYDSAQVMRLSLNYHLNSKSFSGYGQWADGTEFNCTMKFLQADTSSEKKSISKTTKAETTGKNIYPFNAYGQSLPDNTASFQDWLNKEKNTSILIKGATVWTNEKDSIIEDGDVYIAGGKIMMIGKNLQVKSPNMKIIDAKGKHVTPGIIDEHSHIALTQGVNEGAQASSAEVRMGDVINPEDVNIYRQLAGGVTAAQLLHGSANPIGGQSAIIKLRWGQNAQGMKFENAEGFIKFALGENVKQSNWGDFNSVRFPQTRMGVEQVYYDFFTRAREYDNKIKQPIAKTKGTPASPEIRRNLELEAIAEILNKKRFISCHSYVQSEINMLMHVADSMGFKVNTFTHILEGYKVADKMKAHGANASTFADWWAYKNEVMEAIPFNAALLTKMGVNTAINSDDAEMARRLNQEAAKAIKYGGLSEVEALKLVTLNPAKMLHLDNRVGSIKTGKDADLVVWSDNPLSIYAKAEKTLIDGIIYFDRDKDEQLDKEIKDERARIIAKLMAEKQKGGQVVKHRSKKRQLYHCNTLEGVSEEETGKR
jgi:imidazolonepropionase-like amidohydrolase